MLEFLFFINVYLSPATEVSVSAKDQVKNDIEKLLTNFMNGLASGDENALAVLASHGITDVDTANQNEEKAERDEEMVKEDEEKVLEEEKKAKDDEDAAMKDLEDSAAKEYVDIVDQQRVAGDIQRLLNGDF